MVSDYDGRRRLFVKGLDELGLTCPEPGGAFYAFPSIRSSGLSSEDFAEQLLAEQKVAVVPGHVFGPSGEGHVRCSYATALPLLEEALERMERFVRRCKGITEEPEYKHGAGRRAAASRPALAAAEQAQGGRR